VAFYPDTRGVVSPGVNLPGRPAREFTTHRHRPVQSRKRQSPALQRTVTKAPSPLLTKHRNRCIQRTVTAAYNAPSPHLTKHRHRPVQSRKRQSPALQRTVTAAYNAPSPHLTKHRHRPVQSRKRQSPASQRTVTVPATFRLRLTSVVFYPDTRGVVPPGVNLPGRPAREPTTHRHRTVQSRKRQSPASQRTVTAAYNAP
jgi:hypothetical protein